MIVVDASVLANAVGDDGAAGRLARSVLADSAAVAPDLVDVETMSVLRRRWLAGDLTGERFGDAVADLRELPIVRHPALPFLPRLFALRDTLTPYDAVYVALAEVLEAPLVTADRRIARAPGIGCEVQVLR